MPFLQYVKRHASYVTGGAFYPFLCFYARECVWEMRFFVGSNNSLLEYGKKVNGLLLVL